MRVLPERGAHCVVFWRDIAVSVGVISQCSGVISQGVWRDEIRAGFEVCFETSVAGNGGLRR